MKLFRLGTTVLMLSTLLMFATGDSAGATLGPAPPTDTAARQAEPTPAPSRPDLTVGLPDLRVVLDHWDGTLGPGQEFAFVAIVKNDGHGPGKPVRVVITPDSRFTNVRVTDAPGFTCTVEAPSRVCRGGQVPAGQEVMIELKAKAPERAGDYSMTANVDPQNAVEERNEDNNHDSRTFHVMYCASVDC